MSLHGESYLLIQFLLSKGLALTYLIGFTVAFKQYKGLVGEDGILPLVEKKEESSFRDILSLFYFFPSNFAIRVCSTTGIVLSLTILAGIPSSLSYLASSASWLVLWVLFLSFVNAGQEFYSHGWDNILLEAGFLIIFLGGTGTEASFLIILLFRWTLFRMMFGSGMIKIHGDSSWTNLTALKHYYETQPFPNPLSQYFHQLPDLVKKFGVLLTHFMLLVVPFFYFAPQPYAAIAGILTLIYQLMIFSGGNYGWLNLVTSVIALTTFNDAIIMHLLSFSLPQASAYPYPGLEIALAGFIVILSIPSIRNMLSTNQVQNQWYSPLRIVNSYGAFDQVPNMRRQIVLEITEDKDPSDSDWEDIVYYEAPVKTNERPRQVSPYIHRLDYALYFVAQNRRDGEWLEKLLERLLEGSDDVEALFREIPCENFEKIRARVYKYEFSKPHEKKQGEFWNRRPLKTLMAKERGKEL